MQCARFVCSAGANNTDSYSVALCVLMRVLVVGYSEYSHEVLHMLTKRECPPSTNVRYLWHSRGTRTAHTGNCEYSFASD
jgi:hypothetical protein